MNQALRDLSDRFLVVDGDLRNLDIELSRTEGNRDAVQQSLSNSETQLNDHKTYLVLLEQVTEVLRALAELKREEMRLKVENLVTYGLRSVFKEHLTFRIVAGERAKQSTMELKVVSNVNGQEVETDIVNAHGGGLVQVIALLLRIVILLFSRPAPAKVLILDESLAHLSREYLEPAAELLASLSKRLGLQILMVTHSPEFEEAADRIYSFSKNSSGMTIATLVK